MLLVIISAVLAVAAIGGTSAISDRHDQARPLTITFPYAEIVPGEAVTLHAVAADGRPARDVAWDLDGDGRFDDAGGPTATVRFGAVDGPHRVAARAASTDGPLPIMRTAHATLDVDATTG